MAGLPTTMQVDRATEDQEPSRFTIISSLATIVHVLDTIQHCTGEAELVLCITILLRRRNPNHLLVMKYLGKNMLIGLALNAKIPGLSRFAEMLGDTV
jgi:hypothetical protein